MSPAKPKKSSALRRRKRARPRARARSNARAVENALAALAHEIRTPLTGILAFAELLAASDLNARERTWAAGVKEAAEHLTQLTTIVCDAVRAEAVGLGLRRDTFSPRRLAEAVGASLSARAQTSGLRAEVAIAGDLPDQVIGDSVRLRAAIENLIDNAVKFTARGSVTLEALAEPAARNRVRLIFAITDSGIGLTPVEIKKLFRPFAQASEEVSQLYGGTGLGLALVKRLARAMGGDLTVVSKRNSGSTFRLSVVVDMPSRELERIRKGSRIRPGPRGGEYAILCAEDNPYGRVLLNTILAELGHRADFVASGNDAIEAAMRGGYDLVLMDVALAGIDGLEAARRIRALPSAAGRVPIIGISARSASGDEAKAREAGMNVYLRKPISPAALAEAIAKFSSPANTPRIKPLSPPHAPRSAPHRP
jgi:two-component system, sensor histidine kinase